MDASLAILKLVTRPSGRVTSCNTASGVSKWTRHYLVVLLLSSASFTAQLTSQLTSQLTAQLTDQLTAQLSSLRRKRSPTTHGRAYGTRIGFIQILHDPSIHVCTTYHFGRLPRGAVFEQARYV